MNDSLNDLASESGGSIRLRLKGITRSFREGGNTLDILKGIDLSIRAGEMVALVGPSGAGKSTLLQIAGLLERPTTGTVDIDGQPCNDLSDKKRTTLRRRFVGFVYQFHHLLPEFTAAENIVLPQMIAGVRRPAAKKKALELLDSVGLRDRSDHRPGQLSGGEQQRVAIARALANDPGVVLADEPTGNLDEGTGDRVFDMLAQLVHETGVAAIVATHNMALADRMDRVVEIRSGHLSERGKHDIPA
ncbi:ABC transporter ATP-binding protein [Fodinicurvata sp. EGI_FJ10296]|uniref:ABC transporter ATP-binding protein n=1 Tax=Fodinicurvata sp. EGI_FJ10296 TaxID=3231908 RepID=UPI00345498B7